MGLIYTLCIYGIVVQIGVLVRLLTVGARADSYFFTSFWNPIPSTQLPCSALMQGRCLFLLQFDMPCFVDIWGEACPFLQKQRRTELGGRRGDNALWFARLCSEISDDNLKGKSTKNLHSDGCYCCRFLVKPYFPPLQWNSSQNFSCVLINYWATFSHVLMYWVTSSTLCNSGDKVSHTIKIFVLSAKSLLHSLILTQKPISHNYLL